MTTIDEKQLDIQIFEMEQTLLNLIYGDMEVFTILGLKLYVESRNNNKTNRSYTVSVDRNGFIEKHRIQDTELKTLIYRLVGIHY